MTTRSRPESKINRLVENVAATWERTTPTRGTQMIFADMGVNPTQWGYSPYEEIIEKLVAKGIPREQIAAIGDAESDVKKQALFEKVRQGSVRVLIGSTQKMGTGTNVQKRLVALHHLDAPWKPAEVEQRDGRILRQGNENKEVAIYRYVTEGSFDAYMWQALETKARFISQVMTGDNAARRAEDIGSQELSYAEVKAIASGNPAVLTLAEADAELQRLALLKKNHLDEQYVARRSVRDLPATIAGLSERLSKLIGGRGHREQPTPTTPSPLVAGRTHAKTYPTFSAAGWTLCRRRSVRQHASRSAITGAWVLASCSIRNSRPRCTSKVPPPVLATLSRDHHGPRAVLNALERLADGYGSECDRVQRDLGIAQSQLRDYQARLGKPFPHDAYLAELTTLRDQLKAGLSGAAQEPGKQEGPSVSELSERIKALKAANTIEATPQRDRQKHSSAEEPITARIRRRTEAGSASDLVTESDVAPEAEGDPCGSRRIRPSIRRELSRNASCVERQRKDDGPSPP